MVRRQMWYHCFSIIYSSVIILTLCNVNVVQAPHIYFRFIWLLMPLFIIHIVIDCYHYFYTPNRPFSRYLVNTHLSIAQCSYYTCEKLSYRYFIQSKRIHIYNKIHINKQEQLNRKSREVLHSQNQCHILDIFLSVEILKLTQNNVHNQ